MKTNTPTIADIAASLLCSTQAVAADSAGALFAAPTWVWVCTAAAMLVFVAIIYSIGAFRPPGATKSHARNARELIWATVPIAIVVAAATPAMIDFAPLVDNRISIASFKSNYFNQKSDPCFAPQSTSAIALGSIAQIPEGPCPNQSR